MERTTQVDPEAIQYKKIGGASFHATIGGRLVIIKPGQVFYAKPEEIPEGFKDLVIPIDPVAVQRKQIEKDAVVAKTGAPVYELRHRGGGWFDVVDEDGKAMNESALKKVEAEELMESLKS